MSAQGSRKGFFVGSVSHEVRTITDAVTFFVSGATGKFNQEGGPFLVPAIPLGEVSDSRWLVEQLRQFKSIDGLRQIKPSTFDRSERYVGLPFYVPSPRHPVEPDQVNLLLHDRAQDGWPILRQVCEECQVADYRLQVGVNFVDMVVFSILWGRDAVLKAFTQKFREEAHAIWQLTGGKAFFLIEAPSVTILSQFTRASTKLLDWYARTFLEVLKALPEGAGWGFHFCDGRLGGKSPLDNRLTRGLRIDQPLYNPVHVVTMSNTLLAFLRQAGFVPELVHYPLARGNRPPSLDLNTYAPFRGLRVLPETTIYAGAIHPALTHMEQRQLFDDLDGIFGQRVGMAATCGWGSNKLSDMMRGMHLMRAIAHT